MNTMNVKLPQHRSFFIQTTLTVIKRELED